MAGLNIHIILTLPFAALLILYITAVIVSCQRQKLWPLYRTAFWILGIFLSIMAVAGPLAAKAHHDFPAHMLGHLLLGMLGPLLMVLGAPITLLFRTLNVRTARRISQLLKSSLIRFLTDPTVAALLNVGGLWVLYTTHLFMVMQQSPLLHIIVHLHVFLAGYLFTVSMIQIDPAPHRTSFAYRAIVLVVALAGHGILAKYIFACPPNGVPAAKAQLGGMMMYYGGDAVDLFLIIIFCHQWYKAARPRAIVQSRKTNEC